jgi:hypothetical protein
VCTLIIGRDVLGERTVIVAANRDEDPRRPTDPPGLLLQQPRVIGGRDRLAGGTWLAVRERRAVVAMLNRRDRSGEPSARAEDRRSRGLLAIDVAGLLDRGGEPSTPSTSAAVRSTELSELALGHAIDAVARDRYAPFTLVFASPGACWWLAHEGLGPPRHATLPSGWHVLTHMDLDDPREPRTARLMGELQGFRPDSPEQALARVAELLRSHGATGPGPAAPAVCLHQGRMVTVSSSLVWLAEGQARYLHAEGRPCETPFGDHSQLLAGRLPAGDAR